MYEFKFEFDNKSFGTSNEVIIISIIKDGERLDNEAFHIHKFKNNIDNLCNEIEMAVNKLLDKITNDTSTKSTNPSLD